MKSHTSLYCVTYTIGFLDLLGVSMILPLLMIHIRSLGASSLLSGLIGSAYGGLQLFSSPLMGSLSDKKGRRKILILCLLGTTLSYVSLGLCTSLWLLTISRVCSGIFKHSQTLCRAYLAEITDSEEQTSAFGRFNAFSSLGFIIGPMIGGHVAGLSHGFFWVCNLAALCFLINTVLACLFLEVAKSNRIKRKDNSRSILNVFDSMKQVDWPKHWDYMGCRFLLSFAVIIFRSNFTFLVHDKFDFNARQIGYITSFQAAISTSASFFAGSVSKYFHSSIFLLSLLGTLQTLSLLCLTFSPHYFAFLIFLVMLNISNAIARVTMSKIMLERAGRDTAGVLVGVGQSITSLSRIMAPLLAGALQEISIHGPGTVGTVSATFGVLVLKMPRNLLKIKKA